ncbi:MAG: YbaN family protein [Prevotellaceae bacterium]|nr:YbaN family protein [Prevotellaceae bacterium]
MTLGVLGIFLPILPTTPFLLLSTALFARSSKRLYNLLLNHKILGKYIRGFLNEKAIPLRIKIFSISAMWLTMLYVIFFVATEKLWLQLLMFATAIAVTMHILSYKTKINRHEDHTKT